MTSRLPSMLLTLKANQLRLVATNLGLPCTGTKAQLTSRIITCQPPDGNDAKSAPARVGGRRILSIDMGIRNLAMCMLELPKAKTTRSVKRPVPSVLAWEQISVPSELPGQDAEAEVAEGEKTSEGEGKRKKQTCKKLSVGGSNAMLQARSRKSKLLEADVVPAAGRKKTKTLGLATASSPRSKKAKPPGPDPLLVATPGSRSKRPKISVSGSTLAIGLKKTKSPEPGLVLPATPCLKSKKTNCLELDPQPVAEEPTPSKEKAKKKLESFEPSVYAIHANNLCRNILERFGPLDTILIERQRYRSAGGASVLEWTIRVNMFEAMIHAVLQCLRENGKLAAGVESVSPKLVAEFWIDRSEKLIVNKRRRKEDGKIGNVEVELKGPKKIKALKIALVKEWMKSGKTFKVVGKDPQAVVERFIPQSTKGTRKAGGGGKIDDLADCLLQGLTWIRWQENRYKLLDEKLIAELNLSHGG